MTNKFVPYHRICSFSHVNYGIDRDTVKKKMIIIIIGQHIVSVARDVFAKMLVLFVSYILFCIFMSGFGKLLWIVLLYANDLFIINFATQPMNSFKSICIWWYISELQLCYIPYQLRIIKCKIVFENSNGCVFLLLLLLRDESIRFRQRYIHTRKMQRNEKKE